MTAFYIVYFESYDTSDGQEITTFEGDPTQDTFEGHAVNASMPFKSLYQSFMSLYLNEDVYLAQWLQIQDHPVTIVGYFFDLSFINSLNGVDILIMENGVLNQTIVNPGVGVIRVPLEYTLAGEYCYQAVTNGTAEIPGSTSAITLPALSLWASEPGTGEEAWTTGAVPTVTLPGTIVDNSDSEYLWAAYAFIPGYEYTITLGYTNSYNAGASNPRTIRLTIFDDTMSVQFTTTDSGPVSPGGSDTVAITFTATSQTTRVGVKYTSGSDIDLQIDTRAGTETTPTIPAVTAQTITEEICVTVLEECDDTVIADDNIRLLEDGDFRILE
jgi:hypothetical protein